MSGRPHTFVIAEAGVNHNGSLDLALGLVDAAADAGADAVKFQTFQADKLATRHAGKAAYQVRETGASESQLDMLRALELSERDHVALMARCAEKSIEFMSSPFDEQSLALLVKLGVRRLKLGSGELTNAPLLMAAARSGLPLIVSTGMARIDEVEEALGVLAFCYLREANPARARFRAAWENPDGRARVRERVALLQCTTEYPAPPADANLRAMATLRDAFGVACGYSDHTLGSAVSLAAVALGASVIEKHLTLDSQLPGPDHKASLEPAALKRFVDDIRSVELAFGDGLKRPSASEMPNIGIARKSVVAAVAIRKGEELRLEHLTTKRPGSGRCPLDLWELIGTRAQRDYRPDDLID